jgi:hypothetical protein
LLLRCVFRPTGTVLSDSARGIRARVGLVVGLIGDAMVTSAHGRPRPLAAVATLRESQTIATAAIAEMVVLAIAARMELQRRRATRTR